MNDQAIEQMQMKIAFLERANTDLSDVVFRQQREIDALNRRLREIIERLDTAQPEEHPRRLEDERPPHY